MCLSNVYKDDVKAENLLARNIADIRVEGNKIVMTDLMGIRKEIEATIKKVDLMENCIVLTPDVELM